jgi:serine/threonine protein kinase
MKKRDFSPTKVSDFKLNTDSRMLNKSRKKSSSMLRKKSSSTSVLDKKSSFKVKRNSASTPVLNNNKSRFIKKGKGKSSLLGKITSKKTYFKGKNKKKKKKKFTEKSIKFKDNSKVNHLKRIGNGSFSTIVKGIYENSNNNTKVKCAVKIIEIDKSKTYYDLDDFKRECNLLKTCNHINVIKCYKSVIRKSADNYFIDDSDSSDDSNKTTKNFYQTPKIFCYLVTELVTDGDLHNYLLNTNKQYTNKVKMEYLIQIAQGMKYLHSDKEIIHRDLKLTNILINQDTQQIKICDFGCAKLFKNVTDSLVGTSEYIAPEVLKTPSKPSTYKLDIYSFGILGWEVLTQKKFLPVKRKSSLEFLIFLKHNNKIRPFISELTKIGVPCVLCDLLESCWDSSPSKRPDSFVSILQTLLVIKKDFF